MKTKKLLALALVSGLVVGSFAVTAEAAKKKKKKKKKKAPVVTIVPTPVTFYLNRAMNGETAVACGEEGSTFLSLKQQTAETSSCGNLGYGLPAEAAHTAGQDFPDNPVGLSSSPRIQKTTDGVPLTLDATKEVVGKITVNSYVTASGNGVSAGQAKLVAAVSGTTGGASKVLGEVEVTYLRVPGAASIVEFKFKPDAALDKQVFTMLELSLINRGESVAHGFYASNSTLTIPTLVKQIKK